MPIDHFHNDSIYEPHSSDTFGLRYWFDASHYREGGPVIVLQGGETDGKERLPFLQKGIVAKLAEATGGIGVVLEHRYYGASMVLSNFSTSSLRFLSTEQAVADMAYFAQNVVFDGLEHLNLTAPNTAYIAYGGSYAGAMVAFLRKLYPQVYWGAIASSAVTLAKYDYWEYLEAARLFGPKECINATQAFTQVIDSILVEKADPDLVLRLKSVFGLQDVRRSDDFANAISYGIFGLQDLNWDPAESLPTFNEYCGNVSSTELLYPSLAPLTKEVGELITRGGSSYVNNRALTSQMLNFIGYNNITVIGSCLRHNMTLDDCLTNFDTKFYQRDGMYTGRWRPWPYQFCTEWGYLITGSRVPSDQLPLISRTVDLDYTSFACKAAFNITRESNVDKINKLGGLGFRYPRLAFIDGERDPWRAVTPHAIGLPERESTIDEPFILIKDGVHHWDENGVFPHETKPGFPPESVVEAQKAQVDFVRAWMEQWKTWRTQGTGQ